MAGREEQHLRAWLTLLRAPGLTPGLTAQLLERFGDPRRLLAAGTSGWNDAGVPRALQSGLRSPDQKAIDADFDWLSGERRCMVALDDPRYPSLLRQIAQPPLALFCHGDVGLLAAPQIAIVGARAASPQGLETATQFGGVLAKSGLVVTSGLALGVDGAAHRGALDAGGRTIAVCGTSLDRVYPARHRDLAHRIAEHGLLISEFATGMAALPHNFPRRNRIISGLSLGVLVVEAAIRSGSLITARLALEQGREVFAVPGSIHNPAARGCHALIRQGAKLVDDARGVLEEIAPQLGLRVPAPEGALQPRLDATQRKVLEAVGDAPTSFDVLVERVALPVEELSSALLLLELEGLVASTHGGAFMRSGAKRNSPAE